MKLELLLPKSPEVCYRAFCDVGSSRRWVPGLKMVRLVRSDTEGRAVEVSYERSSLTYALVYAYDAAARKVRWVPSAGVADGVSGWAEFAPHPQGCLFTYVLDSQRGRAPEHHGQVARAFAAWVSQGQLP
ncbi:MAG: SRPBCC family protein [Myxococcaceae bacterium]